jgi:hypothetical protein
MRAPATASAHFAVLAVTLVLTFAAITLVVTFTAIARSRRRGRW